MVYLGSRAIRKFFEDLELIEDNDDFRKKLRVPSWVVSGGYQYIMNFIAGLVDSDGWVSKVGAIAMCTKDPVLAADVAFLGNCVGLDMRPTIAYNKKYDKNYYKIFITQGKSPCLYPYMKHKGKLSRCIATQKASTPVKPYVRGVVDGPVGEVIDVSVEDSHEYRCNGVLTHNTFNYLVVYGGGARKAAIGLRIEADLAKKYIHNFYNVAYPGVKKYFDHIEATTNKKKRVDFLLGHSRCFRKKMASGEYWRNAAVNAPIQGCINGNQRVYTKSGLIKIADLHTEYGNYDKTVEVWSGDSWVNAKVIFSGDKPLVKTTTDMGLSIETSPDHRFLSIDSSGDFLWVRAENLAEGQVVVCNGSDITSGGNHPGYDFESKPARGNSKTFSFKGNSTFLWYTLGYIYGDGSLMFDTEDHRNVISIHLGGEDSSSRAKQWQVDLSQKLGIAATVSCTKGTGARMDRYKVSIYNAGVRDFFKSLGVKPQNTYTKQFPEELYRQPNENKAAFLRGLFDSDGTINTNSGISLRSVNSSILEGTALLMNSMGIHTSITKQHNRLTVRDRSRYKDLIGFDINHKKARLAEWKNHPNEYQHTFFPSGCIRKVYERIVVSGVVLSRLNAARLGRLKAGSASRYQCRRMLLELGLMDEELDKLTSYNYQKVINVTRFDTTATMYDLEVVDDPRRRFVCEGFTVHNSAGEIVKVAMRNVFQILQERNLLFSHVKPLLQVHDELIYEVEEGFAEEFRNTILVPEMENAVKLRVPLLVDSASGDTWGDCH